MAPAALLPRPAGRFAPAHTGIAAGTAGIVDTGDTGDTEVGHAPGGRELADVESCADCHPDVAAQWSSSAHAFASFSNPVYRVSIEQYRAVLGAEASRFCGGCHDPALLVDGALDVPVEPRDPRAHAGVSCRVCHGITEVRPDGNGSYTLRDTPIPLPREDDADSLTRHRDAVSRKRIGAELCVPCHRSFLGAETGHPHHLTGMDDITDWQGSAYTGSGVGRVDDPVPRQDCIGCHMQRTPAPLGDAAAKNGTVASHVFLGGHTWLAAMRRDEQRLERTRAFLQGVASIDVVMIAGPGAELDGTGARLPGTETLAPSMAIDVVVRNLGVGHRLPGGVRDAQDTWIELVVRDARGVVIAASGRDHERDPGDTEAHVLRSLVSDEDGVVQWAREVHAFRGPIADHTLAPRDAAVVRYRLDLPREVHAPLELHARLRHRSRNLLLQRAACADARSPRGRAFDRAAAELRGQALDPCAPQPVITLAEHRAWRGPGAGARMAAAADARPEWRRLYEHGLGWLNASQEHLDEARPSLVTALARVPSDDARGQAMVLTALGTLAGRQGRTGEAMEWLDRAERLVPDHAAIATSRGNALARVWRWREAVTHLQAAAARAPRNRLAHAALAMALGSLASDREALAAAQLGLALTPRDEALLRVQALALAALGAADAAAALDAFDRFRAPDTATDLRFACAARDPACAREQPPVHEHRLRTVGRD
jgi:tetratricopeptide (TPR) repeat protein